MREGHLRAVPGRLPEQRLQALGRANDVRVARAQLKRDLAAGRIVLAQVLSDPPACAQTAKLRELLLALPGVSPAKSDRVLAHCRIAHTKTVGGLIDRQRAAPTDLLRR